MQNVEPPLDAKVRSGHEATNSTDQLIRRFQSELGLDHAVYFAFGAPFGDKTYFIGTCPAAWTETYTATQAHRIDPLLDQCRKVGSPFDWATIKGLDAAQVAHLEDTRMHLGSNGLTIPLSRGMIVAGLHLTSEEPAKAWRERWADLVWSGLVVAERVHRLVMEERMENPSEQLSPKQKECLGLLAAGQDIPTISKTIKRSEKTVHKHISEAMNRLNASNPTHAVVKAMAQNLIDLG